MSNLKRPLRALHPVAMSSYAGMSPTEASIQMLQVVSCATYTGQTTLAFEHLAALIPLLKTDRAHRALQRVKGALSDV